MDLSAVIFVALALAWAVYLIPKALQHHDEVAAERLDEGHSDRARVLTRRRASASEPVESPSSVEPVETSAAPRRVAALLGRVRRPAPALSAAGRAARNRRRVLALLLVVLATVWVLTWFAYLPSITPLWPTLAVVGWLVLARVSVVRMQRSRHTVRTTSPVEPVATHASSVEPVGTHASSVEPVGTPARVDAFEERPEVVAEQQAQADDGALWDPLPLTLPTYVGKATARRTVRTIELTGVTSSGHDAADSALAREAEATASEADRTEQAEQRRVAGA